ncbi:MAG: hypothetical protein OZ948_01525 [Deltaproteobacteria bacterium]|nr:hypothetical protein [Deltaproteobacteria bacterium]
MLRSERSARRRGAAALLAIGLLFGCARLPGLAEPYAWFSRPASDDPWSPKIARWQERERAAEVAEVLGAPSTVAAGPEALAAPEAEPLRAKFLRFRAEHRRGIARELAAWLQEQAKLHYVPDGVIDRWATLEETLARNGDDCDGLELLAFHLLLDLGFRPDEVYRAIVVRPSDGQHHMVTLWFEDAGDPWVIDPTGAMTGGMPRMSEVPGWVPLKLFTESAEYTVRSSERARAAAIASSPASGSLFGAR